MEENQKNRMSDENMRSDRNDESLNTSSQSGQNSREGMEQGSGRSYDYESGQESGGSRRNASSDQEGTINPLNSGRSSTDNRSTGEGSGMNTKRSVTGSDFDGQNSE